MMHNQLLTVYWVFIEASPAKADKMLSAAYNYLQAAPNSSARMPAAECYESAFWASKVEELKYQAIFIR